MILGTVLHGASVLSPSFDRALESMTLGNGCGVHMIPLREDVCLDLLLYLILFRVLKRELSEISLVLDASLVKCALLRLADQLSALLPGHQFLAADG